MKNYDNRAVRRQERLLDEPSAEYLLQSGEYGVLSMRENRDGQAAAYGIAINYVWDGDSSIYFHCAPAGHKLVCIDAEPLVCLTIVGATNVISHKFTTAYQSVIVRGRIERGLTAEERMHGIELLIDKYSPSHKELGAKYTEKSFGRTEVLRLTIHTISGKAKVVAP